MGEAADSFQLLRAPFGNESGLQLGRFHLCGKRHEILRECRTLNRPITAGRQHQRG
ncbi:hypothetical protein WQQ_34000 [Hydrocarboniphaga effusa AP103]|uniref:Uncharacterized protein n=1 Tax=Hydrocarboniphaga effusa AP103 TaxID=1172194 RepID=I8T7T4_9GAMM|nr:hypothetical protein WQQ_34000 [Hydrocarboniphaga effusa AP103]